MEVPAPEAPRGLLGKLVPLLQSRAVLALADQAVVSGANFAASFVLALALTKEGYGLYGLGFTIVQLLLNTQSAVVTSAYMVNSPKFEEDERRRYTASVLVHQGILCLVAIIGLGLAALLLPRAGGMSAESSLGALAPLLGIQAVVIAFILLREFVRQLSFAAMNMALALALDIGFASLQLGALGALAWFDLLSPERAFLVLGGAALLSSACWFALNRHRFRLDPARILPDFKSNWQFSRWMFAANLLFLASNQLYPWLLFAFHGSAANGEFQASFLVVALLNPFVLGIGNFLAARTAHAREEQGIQGIQRVVRKADQLFVAVLGAFCLLMLVAGGPLLALATGGKYAGHGVVINFLALWQLLFALAIPASHALNALNRPDVTLKALSCSLGVTATLGVWLVWAFGPAGVAAGLAAGSLAALIFTRLAFWRAARVAAREENTA